MKKNIEIRFFMFLAELAKERHWQIPLLMEIEDEISGLTLMDILDISAERVEAFLINGKVVRPPEAIIYPGDRVALLPPGTPGPYRVLLGIKNTASGSE